MLDCWCCRRGYHIVAVNGSDNEALQQITFKILFIISSVQEITSIHRGDNTNEPREETKIFSMKDGYDKPERLLPAKGFKLSMTSVYLYYVSHFGQA